jgi:hypothetical protein
MVESRPRGAQAEGLEGVTHARALLLRDAFIQAHEDLEEHVHPPAGVARVEVGHRVHHQHFAG